MLVLLWLLGSILLMILLSWCSIGGACGITSMLVVVCCSASVVVGSAAMIVVVCSCSIVVSSGIGGYFKVVLVMKLSSSGWFCRGGTRFCFCPMY